MKKRLFVVILVIAITSLLAGCGVPATSAAHEKKDEEKDSLFSSLPENAVDPIACKNGVFYLTPEEKDKGFFIAHFPEKDGYYCIVSLIASDKLVDPNWDGFYSFEIMEAGGRYGNVLLFPKYADDREDEGYVELLTLAALTGYDVMRNSGGNLPKATYEIREVWLHSYTTPQRVTVLEEVGVPLDPKRELKGEPVEWDYFFPTDKNTSME